MGISERREREKFERRKTILKCARELILSHGVQNVSMEDIAKKAELSKATVYLYFSSKDILLNEICEEAAKNFLERLEPFLKTGIKGLDALKLFWRGYVEMFGNFEEMIIIFQVRNFMMPGIPIVSCEVQSTPTFAYDIIETLKKIINQCKAEGVFDPDLNIDTATRLLLSIFSIVVENAARMPHETRESAVIIEDLQNVFQIIIRGFAKDDVDRSSLNINS